MRGRRAYVNAVSFLLGGGLILACAARDVLAGERPSPALSGPPNIILILTDDLDAASVDSMPNILSLLADEGTSFSGCFVNVSVCVPSRVSTLLGQTAHNHQVFTNLPPTGGFKKFNESGQESSTLATWLQAAGYRTALFGKYLNGYPDRSAQTYVPPGWSEWYGTIKRYFDYRINENGVIVNYGNDPEDYQTDVLAEKVSTFIRNNPPDTPFFVYVAPDAPHRPATPAPRHSNRFATATAPRKPSFNEPDLSDKPNWVNQLEVLQPNQINRVDDLYRSRLQSMLAVDEMVRSIVDTLASTNQLENTYIFFTSDHGFHQGEHRIQQGKQTPYEEAIRVPLFVRGPGVPAGEVVDYLTSNIDLAPTFLELAGAAQQSTIDGRSLVPLLGSDPLPETWRLGVLIEHWMGGEASIPVPIPAYKAVRTADCICVEYDGEELEYYDLTQDPFQVECSIDSIDESTQSLLETLRNCVGVDCFPVGSEAGRMTGSSSALQSVKREGNGHPGRTGLGQNYPNPFNPTTEIRFAIGSASFVHLAVFDVLGREVATLVNETLAAGEYTRVFNAQNLPSGTYFYRMSANGRVDTRKLVLLR
jgi:arylsulfatase A-like enzyme